MNTRSILYGLTLGLAVLALPTAALAADGFARSSGTLRAGAGSNYPAVMRVSSGTSLEVIGCISRYSWCDVAVDGERGWFPGSRIGLLRDGRRVYLSDGGAALGLTILSFGMADYWGSHYSGRPWYNERRWWRGHGPMPPHLNHRPGEIGGPTPAPGHVGPPGVNGGRPGLHSRPGSVGKPPIHRAEPPKVRAQHPTAKPIRQAPRDVQRTNPSRNFGNSNRLQQRPIPNQGMRQGGGVIPPQPSGR